MSLQNVVCVPFPLGNSDFLVNSDLIIEKTTIPFILMGTSFADIILKLQFPLRTTDHVDFNHQHAIKDIYAEMFSLQTLGLF